MTSPTVFDKLQAGRKTWEEALAENPLADLEREMNRKPTRKDKELAKKKGNQERASYLRALGETQRHLLREVEEIKNILKEMNQK